MELSKKAIVELTSLKDEYERKEMLADKKFVSNTLDIIESEEKFHNLLQYEFTEDKMIGPCYSEYENVVIRLDKLIKYAKRYNYMLIPEFGNDEIFAINNMEVIRTLLHEVSHTWQFCYLDDYDEVNRMYKEMDKKGSTFLGQLIYDLLSGNYSFERHANIDAFREVINIYDDSKYVDIPVKYYFNFLKSLYGRLSPVEKTLLFIGVKNDFSLEGIPTLHLLNVGLRVDSSVLNELNNIIEKEKTEEIDYKHALELINKL